MRGPKPTEGLSTLRSREVCQLTLARTESLLWLPIRACATDAGRESSGAEEGERWFSAEAEAQAAGWRRAKNCP